MRWTYVTLLVLQYICDACQKLEQYVWICRSYVENNCSFLWTRCTKCFRLILVSSILQFYLYLLSSAKVMQQFFILIARPKRELDTPTGNYCITCVLVSRCSSTYVTHNHMTWLPRWNRASDPRTISSITTSGISNMWQFWPIPYSHRSRDVTHAHRPQLASYNNRSFSIGEGKVDQVTHDG